MLYIKLPNTYPYRIERFRADHPGTSFPSELSDKHYEAFGVFPVKPTAKPAYDKATQELDESASFISGEWVQVWTIRPATQAEIDGHAITLRNAEDEAARTSAKADATIRYLMTHTDAEITAKIQADGATLAGLRAIVARLAVAVGALYRREA